MPKECLLRIESKKQGGTADFIRPCVSFNAYTGRFYFIRRFFDERENHCFAKRNHRKAKPYK